MSTPRTPVLLTVRFKSSLPLEELEKRYRKRMPEFAALPGLIQKYYVLDPESGELGGFYVWDSQESLDKFLDSDLRRSIAAAYEASGPPRIEKLTILDTLRP